MLKNKRGSGVLTGGSERMGLQRRRSATRTPGESRAALGEGLLQGVSGLLDGTARSKAVLRRSHRDYGDSGVASGEKSIGAELTCGGESAAIPGREEAGVGGCGPRRCLGARRGSCRGVQGPGDGEAAVPRRRRKFYMAVQCGARG
jgi:hypothetical protein